MKSRSAILSLLLLVAAFLALTLKGVTPAALLQAVMRPKASSGGQVSNVVETSPTIAQMQADDATFLLASNESSAATEGPALPEAVPGATAPAEETSAEASGAESAEPSKTADAMEGDGTQVAGLASGGKEFKEFVDYKELEPILAGGEDEAVSGGVGGVGGGGGGAGGRVDLAGPPEAGETESDPEIVINTPPPVVITKTIIRNTPPGASPAPPTALPVPEPGSALVGLAVAAMAFGSLARRFRPASGT